MQHSDSSEHSLVCVHRQLLSRRTVLRTRTSLDRFHWVVCLQHQLVAFRRLTSLLTISSCIATTFINDPARVSKQELLAVNSGVKIILSDLGSTCNVLLSPAVLTLLSHLLVLHGTRHRDLAHSIRSRSSSDRPHCHLGNSLLQTETISLWIHVDGHIRLVLGRYVQVLLPDFVIDFHAFLRVLLACCWHCSFFCSRVLGSRVLLGFLGPFPGCFYFFTAIWLVFHPVYN